MNTLESIGIVVMLTVGVVIDVVRLRRGCGRGNCIC